MTDARVTAIVLSTLVTLILWTTTIITTFYAASHAAYYPHAQNPYYVIALIGIIPTAVSTFITVVVWTDGLKEDKNGRR